MSSSSVLQILVNLIFAAGFVALWIRLNKPVKDDPRLSRGLQLLQSKIAILEDLSDQVERQVQQVAQLMEMKAKDLQTHVTRAEEQMRHIEIATARSLEVARIFQDRIPHEEIIDRKATLKYIKAARLANQGHSIDEIQEQVDLSRGELDFISKVNRDQLQFSDTDLPDWARQELGIETETAASPRLENSGARPAMASTNSTSAPAAAATLVEAQPLMRIQDRTVEPLSALGQRFREALEARPGMFESAGENPTSAAVTTGVATAVKLAATPGSWTGKESGRTEAGVVRKVVFPKIDRSPF